MCSLDIHRKVSLAVAIFEMKDRSGYMSPAPTVASRH